MEQLVSILLFAICASICVSIFASSYEMSVAAKDTENALLIAESGAECYKAASGDVEKAAGILGGVSESGSARVYYDENRRTCEESSAVYVLSIERLNWGGAPGTPHACEVSVEKNGGGQIIAFSVAARSETEGGQ